MLPVELGPPVGGHSSPRGSTSGSYRLSRGGSWGWGNNAKDCRVAARASGWPGTEVFPNQGFRSVLPSGK
jgi:hypothetical protein